MSNQALSSDCVGDGFDGFMDFEELKSHLHGLLKFPPNSSSRMSDLSWRYLESMNRDALTILAAGRRHRLQNGAQPRFGLTAEEIERSTGIAMRLADASRSQAKTRGGADSTESA